jgi:DnaJ-class molecular chaperone
METPADLVTKVIESKESQNPKKNFRQIAKHLHPDKNRHPLAKEAF